MEKADPITACGTESGKTGGGFQCRVAGAGTTAVDRKGVQRLQVHVVDEAVAPRASCASRTMKPMPDAMVSFWLNAAHTRGACSSRCWRTAGCMHRRLCRLRLDRAADH